MKALSFNSEADLRAFGVKCAQCIGSGQVLFLEGDLGAGKTTLAKGLIQGWGYDGIVTSPTFTLVETYSFSGFDVHHFDLYRMESAQELEMIGARDLFNARDICLLEWPVKAEGYLPEPDVLFSLEHQAEGRKITVTGKKGAQLLECIQQNNI